MALCVASGSMKVRVKAAGGWSGVFADPEKGVESQAECCFEHPSVRPTEAGVLGQCSEHPAQAGSCERLACGCPSCRPWLVVRSHRPALGKGQLGVVATGVWEASLPVGGGHRGCVEADGAGGQAAQAEVRHEVGGRGLGCWQGGREGARWVWQNCRNCLQPVR